MRRRKRYVLSWAPSSLSFRWLPEERRKGKAKIGFHIFGAEASVGGTGGRGDERTQTVKLVLNPVLLGTDGGRSKLDIGRRRAGK